MESSKKHILQKLERELHIVELELTDIGHLHATVWEATAPTDIFAEPADMNEMGDFDTAQENNKAVITELQERYKNIQDAIGAVHNDTYGICHVCKKKIPEKRLEANIVALTCIEHA